MPRPSRATRRVLAQRRDGITTFRREFGQRIALIRESNDVSQADLARAIGLDPSAVSRIESGDRDTVLIDALRIADALGVSIDALTPDLYDDARGDHT